MPRYKMVNGERIQLSAEEEKALEDMEKAWGDKAPARRMETLREKRDKLILETDWYGMSDVKMDSDMTVYRQALRDITKQTPTDNDLSNITWPKKPE